MFVTFFLMSFAGTNGLGAESYRQNKKVRKMDQSIGYLIFFVFSWNSLTRKNIYNEAILIFKRKKKISILRSMLICILKEN